MIIQLKLENVQEFSIDLHTMVTVMNAGNSNMVVAEATEIILLQSQNAEPHVFALDALLLRLVIPLVAKLSMMFEVVPSVVVHHHLNIHQLFLVSVFFTQNF